MQRRLWTTDMFLSFSLQLLKLERKKKLFAVVLVYFYLFIFRKLLYAYSKTETMAKYGVFECNDQTC